MKLELTNQLVYVTDAAPLEEQFIKTSLTYSGDDKFVMNWETRKFEFNRAYTRHCLFEQGAFPAGLLGVVLGKLKAHGFTAPSLTDSRVRPAEVDTSLLSPDLAARYYQQEALSALKSGRGIIKLPTGAGKTRLALALMSCVPLNWLFIAPTYDLVEQTARAFESLLNVKPAIIAKGRWAVGPITLAVSAMLARRRGTAEYKQLMQQTQGVVADECHRVSADGYFNVLQDCPAYYRVGLSATPYDHEDGKALRVIGALGRVVYTRSLSDLTEEGFLAKATVHLHTLAQTFQAPNPMQAEKRGIVESGARNALVVTLAKQAAYPALLFVKKKKHGATLERQLKTAGLRVRFVYGQPGGRDTRQQAIKDLTDGVLDIIVCTKIFYEGIDIPSLRSLIIATGGKSVFETIQKLGRGTRLADDKTDFAVYDVLDTCAGDPDSETNPCGNRFNARQAKQRLDAYKSEGHKINIVE